MVMKRKMKHNSMIAIMIAVMMAFSFLMVGGIVAKADVTSTATFSQKVKDTLGTHADKTYLTSGGGSYKMSDLLIKSTDQSTKDIWVIDESKYSQLKSSEQTKFLTDLNSKANEVIEGDSTGAYTDESLTNWYAILQNQEGVGSKMLNMVLANTKPDFVSANKIYEPFSGLVGTVLGLGAVLIMAFLAIVMICDIAYIALPPVRLFAGEENERKGVKSKIFSHDATYAVQVAENSDGGNGSPKQALGIYFKRRVFMLLLLGVCLLYLIQGQIFGLVGKILDLVSGFFGA